MNIINLIIGVLMLLWAAFIGVTQVIPSVWSVVFVIGAAGLLNLYHWGTATNLTTN